MDGGSIAKLREALGHASVSTTERYAHLAPDSFGPEDYKAVTVDLTEGKVLQFDGGKTCYAGVTQGKNEDNGQKKSGCK